MSRNKYDDALGVLPMSWKRGEPPCDTYGLVLVELWQSGLSFWNALRPVARVTATREVRVRDGANWKAVSATGELREPNKGTVRRYAVIARVRTWEGNVSLDGWDTL